MEQLLTPKLYVNPMIDVAFKYLFGTEKNKHLLKGLLEHVFKREIADITYDNTEQVGESVDARNAYFDVVCRAPDGHEFIVECQVRAQEFFAERALFYVSRVISRQAPKGSWDYAFKPVYFLGLIDFPMPESVGHGPGFVHRYSVRNDETGDSMTEKLQYVFMEVGPFSKSYDECTTFEEKFLYYMKNLPNFAKRPDLQQEPYFEELLHTAEYLAMDMETQAMYEKRLKEMRDIQNVEHYFRKVTLAEGMEKGMEKGRAEGKAEAKAETAKKLLALGVPVETIVAATGLMEEEIRNL